MPGVKTRFTESEKAKIYFAIERKRQRDDRDPKLVIDTDYGGDEQKYLEDMVRWYSGMFGINILN